jgi:hypothetical protein
MRKIIEEIRAQPEYIRHIFMWTCVIIVFSVVGFAWFKNTEKKFIALLNPNEVQQEKALAEKSKSQPPSPFATIFSAWDNLRANILELILGSKQLEFNENNYRGGLEEEQLPPQKLPLSE